MLSMHRSSRAFMLTFYGALLYAGFVNILKKYDKQTGASFVFPSSRGFWSCNSIPDHLFPINNKPSIPTSESADTPPTPATTVVPTPTERDGSLLRGPKEQAEIEFMQSLHMKSIISALRRRRIHHQIQGQSCNAKESHDKLIKARKEIVDFHGEMVLLENYSALTYTSLVKMLSFIQRVLQQPAISSNI
ncbi:SPX domain-containing protein 2-like [Papaver somniferum]|uniref:SPX domain-containing protein 2-like n=1 Tax=Papaver somniferum TaxID=3469 RepID=UPI000E6F5528|nr:SPX domain-containing protein 2-like [Papaver somniferum]